MFFMKPDCEDRSVKGIRGDLGIQKNKKSYKEKENLFGTLENYLSPMTFSCEKMAS